ncbi:hypothetical protein ABZX93_13950 [Streptomyces sp. NPDC006632]|uniref:hypothetical protein n=1 Tax=Streptomyces sp. NPDC006632 TaxID=3157182 RepID=UPI0033BE8271
MPRYIRVKIVTPEEEARERRAGLYVALTSATWGVQAGGTISLSFALKDQRMGAAVVAALCAVLGAWGMVYVDAKGFRRPFRTWRFLTSALLSIVLGCVIGM